jgi:MOSC domain-containing protein YiiM
MDRSVGLVLSVNVGSVRLLTWQGKTAPSAIWKRPVAGWVAIRGVNLEGVNLEGDDQGDRRAHGGPDKAIYTYAREDAAWWERQLGRPVEAGEFGENLTLAGVNVTDAVIGERWAVGTAILEVAQPRIPCWKLAARMNDPLFVKRFADAGRPGAYLRIVRAGSVAAGDPVCVIKRPAHGITIRTVNVVYLRDPSQAELLLRAPELPDKWHTWAVQAMASGPR